MRSALAVAAFAAGTLNCYSQPYPSKPIRYIVPTSPGGVNDTSARVVAPRLSAGLATPVIVENRPPNVVGTGLVAKSAADGYTILNALDNHPLTQFLMKDVPYDATKDFAGISLVWRAPQIAAIPAGHGITDLAQFVRFAKSKAGNLNYGAAGAGTSGHLAGELFKSTAGVDMQVVLHKGAGPAVSAVLGGHIDFIVATLGTLLPHIRSGKLVALGVTSPRRVPQLANVPAIAETYPGFEVQGWGGVVVPAGTPPDIIRRLNAELVKIVAEPEVRRVFENQGYEVVGSTPEAFDKWIAHESQKWGRVIRERGITQH
jgi:tripartite-type tricarboxylate transporter receptor subunit TctC